MAVFAISTAIHAAVILGPKAFQERLAPMSPPTQVFSNKCPAAERIPEQPKKESKEPTDLMVERERFIRKTLLSLVKGERIRLSDFLFEGEALDWNIRAVKEGGETVSASELKDRYNRFVSLAKDHVKGKKDTVEALFDFAHDEYYKAYYWPRDSIIDVQTSKSFNCMSATEFFTSLLEDVLGVGPKLILFSEHVKTYLDGKGIENTADYWKDAVTKYAGCGRVAEGHALIADYLISHGVDVKEIPRSLLRSSRPKEWPAGCGERGKDVHPGERVSLGSLGAALFDDLPKSGLSVPSYPVPSGRPGNPPTLRDIQKMARVFFAAYRMSNLDEEEFGIDLKDERVDAAIIPVPEGVDWKMIFDQSRYWDKMSHDMASWPQHVRSYFSMNKITGFSLSRLAELSPSPREDTPYSQKNVCARYKAALSSRNLVEIPNYFQFDFCAALNGDLIKAYRETKDPNLLRYGIGDLELPENYDFFLKELSSTNPDIKRKAAAGLILSNHEKACDALEKTKDSDRRILANQLIIGCNDKAQMWDAFMHPGLYPDTLMDISLGYLTGSDLTKDQLAMLRSKQSSAPIRAKIIFARLFFEAGDKELSMSVLGDAVRHILREGYKERIVAHGLVPEFLPVLYPLYAMDWHSISIAKGFDGTLPYPSYPPQLIASLRRIMKNNGMRLEERFEAAFLLLKFGYHFE